MMTWIQSRCSRRLKSVQEFPNIWIFHLKESCEKMTFTHILKASHFQMNYVYDKFGRTKYRRPCFNISCLFFFVSSQLRYSEFYYIWKRFTCLGGNVRKRWISIAITNYGGQSFWTICYQRYAEQAALFDNIKLTNKWEWRLPFRNLNL